MQVKRTVRPVLKTQNQIFFFLVLAMHLPSTRIEFDTTLSQTLPLKERNKGEARSEAEFLDEIQTKVHRHLYSFALRFLFLQTHATSYSFCNGEMRKT
jgi:hypothetical protein